MDERDDLAERFEEHRTRLRSVAYRMLGSVADVDDAVQETWMRLSRTDAAGVDSLGAWLTTVVARVCLDMLRSRKSRREEPMLADAPEPIAAGAHGDSPEADAVLGDSVGLALLVVLDKLEPAERLAFVLHDMFAVPFDEIAPIVGRSVDATRQLASRARRRVRGGSEESSAADLAQRREVVQAFLRALRAGDFEGLIAVLHPDVEVRAHLGAGAPSVTRGAAEYARQATMFTQLAQAVQFALVDGDVGAVFAPKGQVARALRFTIAGGRISAIEIIGDPARVAELDITLGDEPA